MKGLSRKHPERGCRHRIDDGGPARLPVHGIPDDRPAARGKVRTDLVSASRDEAAAQEARACARERYARKTSKMRQARSTCPARGGDPPPIVRVARQTQVDVAARRSDPSIHNGQVVLLAGLARHRLLQRGVHCRRLCDKDDSRRELVEPSDERRPPRHRPCPTVPEQRVHERAADVRVGRMHDDACRLVQGEQVIVLVKNVQSDVLGPHGRRQRVSRQKDCEQVAGGDARGAAPSHTPVHGQAPAFDPGLDARARSSADVRQMTA